MSIDILTVIFSILNVIDRCDEPLKLLHEAKENLIEGGHILLALVLPINCFIESGKYINII